MTEVQFIDEDIVSVTLSAIVFIALLSWALDHGFLEPLSLSSRVLAYLWDVVTAPEVLALIAVTLLVFYGFADDGW